MTDKRTQVILQCKAVSHMAMAISKIYSDYENIFLSGGADKIIDQVGGRTASLMETIGDMLNNIDAYDEEDKWMDPVFEEAHRLWPPK